MSDSEGLWTAIGAAIGLVGSIATTYLNARLGKPKPDPVAEARKRLLRRMLNDQWTWRGIDVLSHTIGADFPTTRGLLLEIGAQASEDGQDIWALITNLDRNRDKNGKIGRSFGDVPIAVLRRIYGPDFARGLDDTAKLRDVLLDIDNKSLADIVKDHDAKTFQSKLNAAT